MPNIHATSRFGPRRRAFTFLEVILALGMTAMIALAIGSMFYAVGRATSDRSNRQSLVVHQLALSNRLAAAVRGSRRFLAVGSDHVVVWMNDDDGDELPSVAEIRRISFDTSTGTITSASASWPSGWSQATIDASNTVYDLTTDFNTATKSLLAQSYFPATAWSSSLSSCTLSLDNATAQSAALLSYRITLTQSGASDTVVGAVALRNP